MKHIILAIETSTDACSVALSKGGTVYTRFEIIPKEHPQHIFSMINELLEETACTLSELTAVAVGKGPGSFTGVRIAMSVAQGLAFGQNLPIFGISTLAALGYQVKNISKETIKNKLVVPALDARMQEIYTAGYRMSENEFELINEEKVCLPQKALEGLEGENEIIALGKGWDVYLEAISQKYPQISIEWLPDRYPGAKEVVLLAEKDILQGKKGVSAQEALPYYIRDDVAKKSVVT